MTRPALWRRTFAEFLGSAFLAAIVIGSGIAAQRLSPNDVGLQLFENAAATAVGLVAITLTFGPVSGAHFKLCRVDRRPSVRRIRVHATDGYVEIVSLEVFAGPSPDGPALDG